MSQKLSKICFFRPSSGPLVIKRDKTSFFDRFGAPSQLFKLSGFLSFGDLAAERKLRKRFVSTGFASGGVFGAPLLFAKKWPSKICEKVCVEKDGAKFIFLSHVSDHFWRTVSGGGFSCGAERVFGPL